MVAISPARWPGPTSPNRSTSADRTVGDGAGDVRPWAACVGLEGSGGREADDDAGGAGPPSWAQDPHRRRARERRHGADRRGNGPGGIGRSRRGTPHREHTRSPERSGRDARVRTDAALCDRGASQLQRTAGNTAGHRRGRRPSSRRAARPDSGSHPAVVRRHRRAGRLGGIGRDPLRPRAAGSALRVGRRRSTGRRRRVRLLGADHRRVRRRRCPAAAHRAHAVLRRAARPGGRPAQARGPRLLRRAPARAPRRAVPRRRAHDQRSHVRQAGARGLRPLRR